MAVRCGKHEPKVEVVPIRGGVYYGAEITCAGCGKRLALAPPFNKTAEQAQAWCDQFLASQWASK